MTLAVLVAFAILVRLGVWQVQRLQYFDGLRLQIAALETAPAQPLPEALAQLKPGAATFYGRVSLVCPDVETRPVLHMFVPYQGLAGYRLITACPLPAGASYGSILVDRGFVGMQGDEQPKDIPGRPISTPVVGVLRKGGEHNFVTPHNLPAQNQWYWRDIPAMAQALHAPNPAPIFLMLESPVPPSGEPRPIPIQPHYPNNLGYAITWFGLAGALVGVYLAMLFRRRTS